MLAFQIPCCSRVNCKKQTKHYLLSRDTYILVYCKTIKKNKDAINMNFRREVNSGGEGGCCDEKEVIGSFVSGSNAVF